MEEQDLKNIWKNAASLDTISIENNQLIKELNSKITNIQKSIRRRDLREIIACIIGIIIFSYLLIEIPFLITKLACVLSILWSLFVIYKSNKSKKQNVTNILSLSISKQLLHQEKVMLAQQKLLNTAVYWYSIPSFIINFIFILGLKNPEDYNWTNELANNILPLSINFKIIMLIGLALFYGFIVWLNKRAAKKDITPILKNIKNIQQEFKN